MISNFNWGIMVLPVILWQKIMVDRSKHYIMSNQYTIPDFNSPLILKMTSGIDKYIFSEYNILSKICIKRRKKTETFIYSLTG